MAYIKNIAGSQKTIRGRVLADQAYYLIPETEKLEWHSDSDLFDKLSSNIILIAKSDDGLNDIQDNVEAWNYLGNLLTTKVEVTRREPFADKYLSDGSSLFRRKHGVRKSVPGNSTVSITFAVPYVKCKVDEVEVINCAASDTCNLRVRDNAVGTFSTVPNAILNQFGFNVNLSDIYYTDVSNYDATLYQSMVLEVEYENNESETKEVGVNFVLHEVIAS